MAPTGACTFAANGQFMAYARCINEHGVQLPIILVMVDVGAPRGSVVVAHEDWGITPVGSIGPELHRQGAVAGPAHINAAGRGNTDRIVGPVELEAKRGLAGRKSNSVQEPPVDSTYDFARVALSRPPCC